MTFKFLEPSYTTPGKGWMCLEKPIPLAGYPGTYSFCPSLWEAQDALENARGNPSAYEKALNRLEDLYKKLNLLIAQTYANHPRHPKREKFAEAFEPLVKTIGPETTFAIAAE